MKSLASAAVAVLCAPAVCLAQVSEIPAIVETAQKAQRMPGVALVVLKGDEILIARGFGVEAAARKDAVTPDTVFPLNSMSKQLVAALAMRLVDERTLSLDDPVARHLPDFTKLPKGLRIRHLLEHTSGMRDDFVNPDVAPFFMKPDATFAEYLTVARHAPADFAPGSRWSYSNFNYQMLTAVLEKLTGQPLEQALAERLFKPIGLHSFRVCPPQPGQVAGQASGHIERDGALVAHPPENFALFRGPGGFCGSTLDMARWTRALATGKVVSARSYRRMTTPAKLTGGREAEYGLGTMLTSPDGVRRVGHGGYGGGISGQAAYYPDAELTVVVQTNRFAFPEYIERKVARRLLGRPEPVLREVAIAADERARYAGSFDIGLPGWYVQVVDRDGRLWFELTAPKMSIPLVHVGEREFVNADEPDGYRLKFSKDRRELRLLGMGMLTWYGTRRD